MQIKWPTVRSELLAGACIIPPVVILIVDSSLPINAFLIKKSRGSNNKVAVKSRQPNLPKDGSKGTSFIV